MDIHSQYRRPPKQTWADWFDDKWRELRWKKDDLLEILEKILFSPIITVILLLNLICIPYIVGETYAKKRLVEENERHLAETRIKNIEEMLQTISTINSNNDITIKRAAQAVNNMAIQQAVQTVEKNIDSLSSEQIEEILKIIEKQTKSKK